MPFALVQLPRAIGALAFSSLMSGVVQTLRGEPEWVAVIVLSAVIITLAGSAEYVGYVLRDRERRDRRAIGRWKEFRRESDAKNRVYRLERLMAAILRRLE